jgi:TPR repeat protein
MTAMFRQGRILMEGAEGVPKDEDKGRFCLNAAAEAGQADAIARMGQLEEAAGNKADATVDRLRHFGEARRRYEKACESSQPDALFGMVRFYDEGLDVPKDPVKATDFLFRAAKAGHLVAMNEMGVRYQQGSGIRQDNVAAIGWFLSAAESGLPAAMTNLAASYETGNGVPQNFDRAGSWYAQGAKLHYAPAQFGLARLFESGLGTEKNPVFAYVNYSLAAASFPEAAKKRDALKTSLSAAQLQEAAKLLNTKSGAGTR